MNEFFGGKINNPSLSHTATIFNDRELYLQNRFFFFSFSGFEFFTEGDEGVKN